MPAENLRKVLRLVLDKTPGVLFDIMDPEGDPPQQPPTGEVDWCICSNCIQMPTVAERVCCGYQPQNCLTTWPVSASLFFTVFANKSKSLI